VSIYLILINILTLTELEIFNNILASISTVRDNRKENNKSNDCRTSVVYDFWRPRFYNTKLLINLDI